MSESPQQSRRPLPLPLSPRRWAWLQAPFPVTAQEWKQMMDTLEAMRPALVAVEGEEVEG